MLADVGIEVMVMMKLVTNDACFFRPAKAVWFIQPAHNDRSDTRERKELICLRCTFAQQRRRQTGASEMAYFQG